MAFSREKNCTPPVEDFFWSSPPGNPLFFNFWCTPLPRISTTFLKFLLISSTGGGYSFSSGKAQFSMVIWKKKQESWTIIYRNNNRYWESVFCIGTKCFEINHLWSFVVTGTSSPEYEEVLLDWYSTISRDRRNSNFNSTTVKVTVNSFDNGKRKFFSLCFSVLWSL